MEFTLEDLKYSTTTFPSTFTLEQRLLALAEQGRLNLNERTAPLIHPNEFTKEVRVAQFLYTMAEFYPQEKYNTTELEQAFNNTAVGYQFHPNLTRSIYEQHLLADLLKGKTEISERELLELSSAVFDKATYSFKTTTFSEREPAGEHDELYSPLRYNIIASFMEKGGYAKEHLKIGDTDEDLEQANEMAFKLLGKIENQINDYQKGEILTYDKLEEELLKINVNPKYKLG